MKKTSLEVNERDKKLLIILGMIIIIFILYYFIVEPSYDKSVALKQEADLANAEYTRVSQLMDSYDTLILEEKRQKENLSEKYKMFFYEVNEERILYKLDTLMVGAGFPLSEYEQSVPFAGEITTIRSEYKELTYPLLDLAQKINDKLITEDIDGNNLGKQENDQDNQAQVPSDSVSNMDIVLSFEAAGYDSILNFIKSLEVMDRAIIIKDINITKLIETGTLQGEITLSIYALPKVDDEEQKDLEFKPIIVKGRANPF